MLSRMFFFIVALVVAQPAWPSPGGGEGSSAQNDCRVPMDGDATATDTQEPGKGRELTEQLNDCRGVLTPPRTGDNEIATPPPKTGTMPVIRPDAVPEQQHPG